MRLRKLALAVGLAGAMGADLASALGLGEIKLLSRLNQPLEAEIKLLQVRDLNVDEIRIALASGADFDRAGIDRLYFLSSLKFDVDLNAAGGPVVRVTSPQPVREPYLNFLLDTQWPSGRILREYTLLLDLPVFGDDSARPVEMSRSQVAPVTRPAPRPAAQSPAKAAEAQVAAEAPAPKKSQAEPAQAESRSGEVYGPVSANDTLWQIALKVRPGREFTVQQTMLAIQRLNPEAFINGNINLLRRGQVLRVPTAEQITEVSRSQAVSEVAQQNNQWGGAATGPQLDASKSRSTTGATESGVTGRLKVAAAESSSAESSGRAAGDASTGNGAEVETLQNELAISMEELDRSKRENTQLQGRVQELQEQIDTMERLLQVSSQELAALQQAAGQEDGAAAVSPETQVAEAGAADTDAAAASSTAESVDGAAAVAPGAEEAPAAVAETSVAVAEKPPVAEEKKPAVEKQKPDPTKVVQAAKPQPGLMDMVMENITYVGAGLAAILLGLLLLLKKRKQEDGEVAGEELELAFDDVSDEEADDAFDAAVAHELAAGELGQGDAVADDDADVYADEVEATRSQTGDVVSEADIYISLGKFEQAEEMLLGALEADPSHDDARLKLLEIYAETHNLSGFEQQYAALEFVADDEIVARAQMLRGQLGDLLGQDVVAEPMADELDGLDFDLGEEQAVQNAEADTADALEFDLSDEFSFDLDEGTVKGDDLTLDFDSGTHGESLDFNLDGLEPDSLAADDEFAINDEPQALDFDLDKPAAVSGELEALDFDFDFESGADSDETETETEIGALAFELDKPVTEAGEFAFDDELSVSPEEGVAAGEEGDDLLVGDAPAFEGFDSFDLELSPVADSSSDETAFQLPADDSFASADDAFDVDLDALDLDALDQELDALSADVDLAQLDAAFGDAGLDESPAGEFELPPADTGDAFVGDLDDAWLDTSLDSPEPSFASPAEQPLNQAPSFSADTSEAFGLEGDDAFGQGLTDLPSPEDVLAGDDDLDADLDFLADTDEVATKLDLARAYIDMGDRDGARDILDEVVAEGSDQQRVEAEELISRMG